MICKKVFVMLYGEHRQYDVKYQASKINSIKGGGGNEKRTNDCCYYNND